MDCPADAPGWELLEELGRRRGFRISGGDVDLERAAKVLLDEYRGCKSAALHWKAPRSTR